MTSRAALVVGIALGFTASGAAQDITFHKSTISDADGKEHKVDLTFEGNGKTIVLRQNKSAIAFVPYSALDQLAYGYSKRYRVKEGVEVLTSGCGGGLACFVEIPVNVAFGSAVMFTKTTSHWFYIDYTDVNGKREVILRLDKSEYQKVIDAAKARTGKDVDLLPEQ